MKRCPECGFRTIEEERICPLCGVRMKTETDKRVLLHSHREPGETCVLPRTEQPRKPAPNRPATHTHPEVGERCALPNQEKPPVRETKTAKQPQPAGSRWIGAVAILILYFVIKSCGA